MSKLLRDPETCYAALDLSVKIQGNKEGLGGELTEERRLRMMDQIKSKGQEEWHRERHEYVPHWMLHPDLRHARTKRNSDDSDKKGKKARVS